jgi:hypothetical protein
MIKLALAIGIFSEREAARCHIMREIRNLFAHNSKANLLLEPVKKKSRTAI